MFTLQPGQGLGGTGSKLFAFGFIGGVAAAIKQAIISVSITAFKSVQQLFKVE